LENNQKHSSCVTCPKNCLYCNEENGECTRCENKYFLKNGLCVECLPNCVLCNSSTSCMRCNPNLEFINGICQENIETIQLQIKSKKPENKVSDPKQEQPKEESKEIEKSTETGCEYQIKDVQGKCYMCDPRFYLNSDYKCMPCLANCKKCLSDRLCLQCDPGFNLEFDKLERKVFCQKKNSTVSIQT
jgi:proprotein convertase subtilisin/kexin type 5